MLQLHSDILPVIRTYIFDVRLFLFGLCWSSVWLWIAPEKCPTNRKNVRMNRKNVRIFLYRKNIKTRNKNRERENAKTSGQITPMKTSRCTDADWTRRPSAGYALPCGHAYRRGGYRLTPAKPGLRAPARQDRQAKPRALTGRGARLDTGSKIQKSSRQDQAGARHRSNSPSKGQNRPPGAFSPLRHSPQYPQRERGP